VSLDCITANRLRRGSINPRHKNILLKRFLAEDFNSRSPQLLKNAGNLREKKTKNFKFESRDRLDFKSNIRFQFSVIKIL
jgi:hypothetical protein